MNTIPTNRGPMTPEGVLDFLMYANYAHNRRISPHITPRSWKAVYPNVDAMEARFQAEEAIAKAAS